MKPLCWCNCIVLSLLLAVPAASSMETPLALAINGGVDSFGVSLVPEVMAAPAVGERFTIEMHINGISNPITGGGFKIDYDPTHLAFVYDSFRYVMEDSGGDVCLGVCYLLEPVIVDELNGIIELALSLYFGIGIRDEVVHIADASFEVIAPITSTSIETDGGGIGGPIYCLSGQECEGLQFFGMHIQATVADEDVDGIADALDNCTAVANEDQRDTNGDGYGNACDPDLDNDGLVDFNDLTLLKSAFFGSDNLDADLNGDLQVNFADFGVMKTLFFGSPGPSGIAMP